jgi:hypothetical protein
VCFWLFPSSKRVHKVGNRHLSLSTTRLEPQVYVRGIKGWICTAPPGYARTGVRAYISYVELALLHCCFGVSKMRPIPTHTCPAGVSRLVWISPTPLHEQQVRIPAGGLSAHHVMNDEYSSKKVIYM